MIMGRRTMPSVVRRIREHGGIHTVDTVALVGFVRLGATPADDCPRKLLGWQSVVICEDGHRIGLTPEEEKEVESWPCTPG